MSITGTVPTKVRAEELVVPVVPSTRFVDLAGSVVGIGEWLTVLEILGAGQLEQFHARSPNTNFRVSITVDGLSIFNKTYNGIRQIGQNSPEISAFAELDEDGDLTGYYIASLRDIPYHSSISIKVQNTGLVPVTFSQLFVKYIIKGG